jgi:gamma-glutamyl-gamma-aminobutyrate hydrolase PuuD
MDTKRKIYVVGGSNDYANWMQGELVKTVEEADLIVATGGEDWFPGWYQNNTRSHPTVSWNLDRDEYEMPIFKQAIAMGKKLIGICRGAQGGCVLAGGALVQHQGNPSYIHRVKSFNTDKEILVTSSHHQAQYPFNLKEGEDYKILQWTEGVKPKFLDYQTQAPAGLVDVETAIYPKINFLAIQSHPEWQMRDNPESVEYFRNLLDMHMKGQL